MRKSKRARWALFNFLAERVGFEPTVRETRTPDFESGPFDHSGTSPHSKLGIWICLKVVGLNFLLILEVINTPAQLIDHELRFLFGHRYFADFRAISQIDSD